MPYLAKDFRDERYFVSLYPPVKVKLAGSGVEVWYPDPREGEGDPLWLRDGICSTIVNRALIKAGETPHGPGEVKEYRHVGLDIKGCKHGRKISGCVQGVVHHSVES